MTAGATFLAGAQGRLLPLSLPFRFFVAALVFLAGSWTLLFLDADVAVTFQGGPGMTLGAIHFLTLGVFAMTAIGASCQLLPVVTRRPLAAVWPVKAIFWTLVPGILLLTYAMTYSEVPLLIAGGILVATALTGYAVLLCVNLVGAHGLGLVRAYAWGSLLSLVAIAVIGVLLALNYRYGFIESHMDLAAAHVALAAYGFMGLLVLGLSQILIPMFALSKEPSRRLGTVALVAAVAAIGLAVAGLFVAVDAVVVAGAAAGLVAVGAHLLAMERSLAGRMRRRLGLSFLLVRGAWALMVLSILLAGLTASGWAGPWAATLFGFVLLYGWLLTFLVAILQRIMPFLGALHAARAGGRPPLVSQLTSARALQVHAIGHVVALVAVGAGITAEQVLLVRIGAGAGILSAAALVWFGASVLLRIVGFNGLAAPPAAHRGT
jgi:hypothetical protein